MISFQFCGQCAVLTCFKKVAISKPKMRNIFHQKDLCVVLCQYLSNFLLCVVPLKNNNQNSECVTIKNKGSWTRIRQSQTACLDDVEAS